MTSTTQLIWPLKVREMIREGNPIILREMVEIFEDMLFEPIMDAADRSGPCSLKTLQKL